MIAALIALLAVVNNPNNSVTYACDGVTAAYTVNFPYLASSDLVVTTTTAAGVVTTLTQVTDWTVNLSSTSSTAALTLNSPATKCPTGNTFKITRTLAVTQPTSFRAQTTYSPNVHEQAYDRAVMISQQQAASIAANAGGLATTNAGLATEIANRVSADTATNNLLAADLAAMSAGGAPGVAASNSTVIATGATSSLALKDVLQAVGYNLAYFLPVGYVTDCSVDYTAQINAAITATQNSVVTHTLRLPKGCFKVTAGLSTTAISVLGEEPDNTELDFYGTGAAITFLGNNAVTLAGFKLVSKAASQTGVIVEGSWNWVNQIRIEGFDTRSLQLGVAGVIGTYYSQISNIFIYNATTQGQAGVYVSGSPAPSSNANHFVNVTVTGRFTRHYEIYGTKNIFDGGDAVVDTQGTGVGALWYIDGIQNEIRGSYSELAAGSNVPTTVATFTANSASNKIVDVYLSYQAGPATTNLNNQSKAFSDLGWNNKIETRAVGFNYLTVSANRGIVNLVPNSGFQQFDASGGGQPLGWVNFAGTFAQDTVTVHGTATSLKATGAAQNILVEAFFASPSAGDKSFNQVPIALLQGKQISCSVWCKSSFAGIGNLRVVADGTGGTTWGQSVHSGGGGWELLTASGLIPTDATKAGVVFRASNSAATLTGDIWFSEPVCTAGTEVPHYSPRPLFDTGAQLMGPLIPAPPTTLTYGVAVATDASQNNSFLITVTNGVAFTISNPTNLKSGQLVLYTLANTSGGAMGAVTLGATFKAPTLVLPATGTNRSYQFQYNGTNLRFLWQTASDVPN